jgi:hypothetical protein
MAMPDRHLDRPPARSKRCSICRHSSLSQVEAALALGLSCNAVAERYRVSEDAVWRHRRSHMSAAHQAALLVARSPAEINLDDLQKIEADRLLSELVDQRVRLRALHSLALSHGRGGVPLALSVEGSIRATLMVEMQLLAPLLGANMAKDVDVSTNLVQRIERLIIEPVSGPPGSAVDGPQDHFQSSRPSGERIADQRIEHDHEPSDPPPSPDPPERQRPPEPVVRQVLFGRQSYSR